MFGSMMMMNTRLGSAFVAPAFTSVFTAAIALTSPVFAQVKQVDPYYVVTTEKLSLRCGEGDLFYKVGEVAAGSVLFLDGEGTGWSRVTYPTGVYAYVKAEEVEAQGSALKLTQASKLKAANLATGWSGSWKALLGTPLPVGTALKAIEPVREGESGPVVGYKVVAPEAGRVFVETRAIRKATDTQVQQFKTKGGPVSATPETTKPPALPAVLAPTPPVPKPEATKAAEQKPIAVKPPEVAKTPETKPVIDLTQPIEKPGVTPSPPPSATPPGTKPPTATATPATPPADSSAAVPPAATINQVTAPPPTVPQAEPGVKSDQPQPDPRPVAVVYDLESTFQSVWKQPLMSAEMDELIAQYNRSIDSLGDDSARLKQQLTRRADALELRVEMRNKLRAIEDAKTTIEAGRGKVHEQIALADQARVYTIVGQLQPSTVYDGTKLPLMYRIISVGGGSPRTLGYLKDEKELLLVGKVGAVIGVIGEAQLDRSLQLNIITPVRVDVLKPKGDASNP